MVGSVCHVFLRFWCASSQRSDQNRDNLTCWQEMMTWSVIIKPNLSRPLSVAAWPAERAAYGATQIWVASGYLHHKSLGVPPQSWRHVDHPRWTLGPATCRLLVQLPLLPSTAMDILFAQVPDLHWRPMSGSPSLLPPSVYPESSVLLHSCCPSAEALYPPPSDFCFLRFFLYLERSGSVFVCLLALATFNVFSCYFPHRFLFPSFLPPSIPLCAHCKCGTWEYGRHNAGSFIPSCKRVHNGLDVET